MGTSSLQMMKDVSEDTVDPKIVCSYWSFAGENMFKSAKSRSFVLNYGLELGQKWSNTGFFYTFGLGFSIVSSSSRRDSMSISTNSSFIKVPAHLGYLIGNPNKLHIAARAGVYTNFLLRAEVNDEKLKVDFSDRFSWNGCFRVTFGIKKWGLLAEYVFPFQSGGEGMLVLGFNYGI